MIPHTDEASAYVYSAITTFIGCVAGYSLISNRNGSKGGLNVLLLLLATACLGGTATILPHFLLTLHLPPMEMDSSLFAASICSSFGFSVLSLLSISGGVRNLRNPVRLALSGVLFGVASSAMHFFALASLRGSELAVRFDPTLAVIACLISVAPSVLPLIPWLRRLRGRVFIVVGPAILTACQCLMHHLSVVRICAFTLMFFFLYSAVHYQRACLVLYHATLPPSHREMLRFFLS